MKPDAPDPILLLDTTLKTLGERHNGFSGNCAQVASVLNEVLGVGGDYVVVVGEHYEYADHVFVRWQGLLWDMDGGHTEEDAEAKWCDEDDEEEDAPTLEDFPDPTDSMVGRLADNNNVLAGGFDAATFRDELVQELSKNGFGQAVPDANLEREPIRDTPAPRPRSKRTP